MSSSTLSLIAGSLSVSCSVAGDTVNTSSRMQSTGVQDRIHVSEATALLLKHDYQLEPRQTPVKGKGVLTTYLVGQRISTTRRTRRMSLIRREDDLVDEVCTWRTHTFTTLYHAPVSTQHIYGHTLTLIHPHYSTYRSPSSCTR